MTYERWIQATEERFLVQMELGQVISGVQLMAEACASADLSDCGNAAVLRMRAEMCFEAAKVFRRRRARLRLLRLLRLRRARQIELDRWADDGGRAA